MPNTVAKTANQELSPTRESLSHGFDGDMLLRRRRSEAAHYLMQLRRQVRRRAQQHSLTRQLDRGHNGTLLGW